MICTGTTAADIQVVIERALQAQLNNFESFLKCELPDLLVDKLVLECSKGVDSKLNLRILEPDATVPQVRTLNELFPRPRGDSEQEWGVDESSPGQFAHEGTQDTSAKVVREKSPRRPSPQPSDKMVIEKSPPPQQNTARTKREKVPVKESEVLEPKVFFKNARMNATGFGQRLQTHVEELKGDRCFLSFVEGPIFSLITSLAILANAIYIGWETNQKMKNEFTRLQENSAATIDPVGEYIFISFFIVEMFMRIVAHKSLWFLGKDRYWNIFDAFLIFLSFIQLVGATGSNLSVFRVFRVFRLVRLLKVVRRMVFLESLKLMLFGIVSCIMPLFWAIMLLLIIMYAFGVFFMSCVVGHLHDQSSALASDIMEGLDEKWGTMYRSMCILFEGVTGGNDWSELAKELRAIGEAYYLCYALYIVFVTLGVLNIVTGFFVDGTHQASVIQKDEMLRVAQEKKNMMMEMMRELFEQLDTDDSGKLSLDEFESHLEDEDLQEYFCMLDMDKEEARNLFVLLDIHNEGEIDIDQFVAGILKVMGSPKNLDICGCLFQSKRAIVLMENLVSDLRKSGFIF